MSELEPMIGPVAEALGVSRAWLLERDTQLPDTVDLPVSLLVELLNAADCLYETQQVRDDKFRRWLCRISGRSAVDFDHCMPLLLALRRQFRLTRDEDLSDVTVWRRREARPAVSKAQVEITIRPENGGRLKKLAKQLGSAESAIEFLLQMEEHCGRNKSQHRTRWPPKIHYEAGVGQLKIDVGTELVSVVLSQFKPATTTSTAADTVVAPPSHRLATTTLSHTSALQQQQQIATADVGAATMQPPQQQQQQSQQQQQGTTIVPHDDRVGHLATSSVVASEEMVNGHVAPDVDFNKQQQQQCVPAPPRPASHVVQTVGSSSVEDALPVAPSVIATLPSVYQRVERDATLPAQMFADDDAVDFPTDLAPPNFTEPLAPAGPQDQPTDQPTEQPTEQPTDQPTEQPTSPPASSEAADDSCHIEQQQTGQHEVALLQQGVTSQETEHESTGDEKLPGDEEQMRGSGDNSVVEPAGDCREEVVESQSLVQADSASVPDVVSEKKDDGCDAEDSRDQTPCLEADTAEQSPITDTTAQETEVIQQAEENVPEVSGSTVEVSHMITDGDQCVATENVVLEEEMEVEQETIVCEEPMEQVECQ